MHLHRPVHHAPSGLPQAVCGVYYRSNGMLLVVSRRHQDLLGLVGGKQDFGETAQEALVRETLEETGVSLDPAQMVLLHESICAPESAAEGHQEYWTLTFVVPFPEGQIPQEKEAGIVPLFVTWDDLITRSAFKAYNQRVQVAFAAYQARR